MREIFTDMLFKCGNHNATKQLSKYNNNVYLYHFDHVSSFNIYLSNKVECFNHTCHEFEMYYVFEPNMATMIDKKNNKYGNATWTNSELMLSKNIQRFWGNFAINGMPGSSMYGNATSVEWISYNQSAKMTMVLDTGSNLRISPNYDNNHCHFWDSLGYYWLN